MRRLLVLCLVVLTPALAVKAQDVQQGDPSVQNIVTYAPSEPAAAPASPQVFSAPSMGNWQVAIGYQYNYLHLHDQTADNGNGFHTSGYDVSFVRYFNSWFGLEGQAGFGFGKTGATTNPHNLDIKSLFVGGGPRFSYRSNGRWEPWGHGIVGLEHFRFTQTATNLGSDSTIGWLAGGGLDFHVSQHIALRGEGDYLGTQFFGASHRNFQVVAGVVMNF